jgi:hypothetical protein
VKILLGALLIALAVLQQPAARNAQTRDIENAYRANNRGVALLEQFATMARRPRSRRH